MAEDVAAEAGVVQGWRLDPHICVPWPQQSLMAELSES